MMLLAASIVFGFYSKAFAAAENSQGLYESNYVDLGLGMLYHHFSSIDDFRAASGVFGDDDKIDFGIGFQFNAELLLNKTFSMNIPLGLALGYKWQVVTSGVSYSSPLFGKFKREINLTSNIVYFSAALPLDSEKYCHLGASCGIGASEYEWSEKWTGKVSSVTYPDDMVKTAKGFVVPIDVFFDWGADGIGARIGYEYMFTHYAKIEGSRPNGNGYQIYLNIRYGI
jgi:hypothetical protein